MRDLGEEQARIKAVSEAEARRRQAEEDELVLEKQKLEASLAKVKVVAPLVNTSALNVSAFEKLVQPALPLLRDEKSDDGSGEPNRVDLRRVFAEACAERADVGSGWDAAASGQMTLWAFTEAMLRLAARVRDAGSSTTTASSAALAPALERLVAACRA